MSESEPVAFDVVSELQRAGVRRVFALCGDHLNPLYMACAELGMEVVNTRHEAAAVHMADAWARTTRQIGVAFVTGGPGLTNAVTGIATAHLAGSPVLVIAGQSPMANEDRGGLQEIPQLEIVREITKWSRVVRDPARVREYLDSAICRSLEGHPGPVFLAIPVEVFKSGSHSRVIAAPPSPVRLPGAGGEEVIQVAELISAAARPVLIAGSDAHWAHAEEALHAFVAKTGMPTFTIDLARGLVADRVAGMFGYADPALNPAAKAIADADLVLLVGHNLDFRTQFGALVSAHARVVELVVDQFQHGRNRTPDLALLCDLPSTLRALTRALGAPSPAHGAWASELRAARARGEASWKETARREPASSIHPLDICEALGPWLDDDTCIVLDGGDFVQWPRAFLSAGGPGQWLRLGPMSTLGAGLPFANAVQLARPESRVILLTGDGGFGFYGFELHTTGLLGLPIKVVMGNDGLWGTERRFQTVAYGAERIFGIEVGGFPYDKYAQLFGAWGAQVSERSELGTALEELMRHEGPGLLNVSIVSAGQPSDQR